MSEQRTTTPLTLDQLVGRFREIEDDNARLKAQVAGMNRVVLAASAYAALAEEESPDEQAGVRVAAELIGALQALSALKLDGAPAVLLEPTESKVGLTWTTAKHERNVATHITETFDVVCTVTAVETVLRAERSYLMVGEFGCEHGSDVEGGKRLAERLLPHFVMIQREADRGLKS